MKLSCPDWTDETGDHRPSNPLPKLIVFAHFFLASEWAQTWMHSRHPFFVCDDYYAYILVYAVFVELTETKTKDTLIITYVI